VCTPRGFGLPKALCLLQSGTTDLFGQQPLRGRRFAAMDRSDHLIDKMLIG